MVLWFEPQGIELSTFITLLLSLVGGVTVLYVNAKAWRKLRDAEQAGPAPRQAVQARILLISTLLAVLAAFDAGVAYGGGCGWGLGCCAAVGSLLLVLGNWGLRRLLTRHMHT